MSKGIGPAFRAGAVTPSDTTVVGARALYVGVAGDVAVVPEGQTTAVTFKNRPVGDWPISVSKVMATNTTATDIVAYY